MVGDSLVGRAEREADMKGIDVDAITTVDSDADGDTIRVIYEDAPTEADQVGFQVTRPPGPMGDQMFQEQLSNGFNELRNYISGSDDEQSTDSDDDSAATTDTETEDAQSQDVTVSSNTVESPMSDTTAPERADKRVSFTVETQLSEDDREHLEAELDELAADLNELPELKAQLDDQEERIEALEAQLEALQSGLSGIVSADTSEPESNG